jgi:IstB-like ATP binding protein
MLTHPTLDQLRALKLDGMAQAFVELETQEEVGNLAHAEWLALLLDREAANRNTRRFQTRLRAARLRHSQAAMARGYWRTHSRRRDLGSCPQRLPARTRRPVWRRLQPMASRPREQRNEAQLQPPGRPRGSTGTSRARRCVSREGTPQRARVAPVDYGDGLHPA